MEIATPGSVAPRDKLAVMLACYNRKNTTLECLRNLTRQFDGLDADVDILLFDDGCTDGTADAVAAEFPFVKITRGDGNYFWNRSMRTLFERALQQNYAAYIWLNDDTQLKSTALSELREASKSAERRWGQAAIAVGAIADPVTGRFSYGGSRRVTPNTRPFLAEWLEPDGTLQRLDMFNGNFVYVPRAVAQVLGPLDATFEHGMGDTDYALRAVKAGIPIVLTPAYVGTCARNSTQGTYHDRRAPWMKRVRSVFSRKGLPWRSWLLLCRRHGGALWPVHFVWGYLKVVLGRG